MTLLLPAPFAARSLEDLAAVTPYDGVLCSIGFEARARAIAEHLPPSAHRAAIGFERQHVLSYCENRKFFEDAGFECDTLGPAGFRSWLLRWFEVVRQSSESEPMRLGIDISSMTRLRIAAVVQGLAELEAGIEAEVDLLYAPETYHDPAPPAAATLTIGPVSGYFAGWALDLERPLIAIVGVGYEPDKAAGAIEYVEPQETVAFLPVGRDDRFATKVAEANKRLWANAAVTRVEYPLDDPFETFRRLESTTSGALRRARPLLLPMGPKIFAVCCLVAAALHEPEVAVWRVSGGELEVPVDRHADGTVFGLTVRRRRAGSEE